MPFANYKLCSWTSTLSYQSGNATGFILIGTLIQAIMLLNNPDYPCPNWQATLMAIAAIVITILANYFGSKLLPRWQNPAFAIHILAYFAFLIPVWRNAPKADSKQVWTDIQNSGGWSSLPLSVMIGQFPAIAAQTTVDPVSSLRRYLSLQAINEDANGRKRRYTCQRKCGTPLHQFPRSYYLST